METVLGYNESEERREAMGPKAKQSPESMEFGEWLCMDVLKKIPHRH